MKFLLKIIEKRLERFNAFEQELKGLKHITIAEKKQKQIKERLLHSIGIKDQPVEQVSFSALIGRIRELALQIQPGVAFSALLREKLIAVAEFHTARFPLIPGFFRHHRRTWTAVFASIFIFTLLFNFTFNIKRVEASFTTVLEEAVGDVTILRDSSAQPGTAGLLLKVDDVIKTGKASKAVIRFLDQSVSRLDENTEIRISKLFVNPLNKTETIVELVLNEGRLWSRVINLIDNISRFQVKAKNTVAVVKKKAAFNVSVSSGGGAKVSAVQNHVDVLVATDKKVIETTLVRGFSSETKSETPAATPQIKSETAVVETDNWVSDNLAQDKTYIETVKQEAKDQNFDQVQVLPGNPFYAMKELSEGTKIVLTLDEFERQKKTLYALQEKLAEARTLFERGNPDKAQETLKEFQLQMKALFDWATQYEITDTAKALELKTQIFDVLNTYQKQLVLMLPHEQLYPLKEIINQTQLLIAGDNIEQKTQKMLSQASDKLLEAHELAEQGDTTGAKEQVEAYKEAVSTVVSEVKQMPTEEKEKAVATLLDNKAEDLKALAAIAAPAAAGQATVSGAPIVGSSTIQSVQISDDGTTSISITMKQGAVGSSSVPGILPAGPNGATSIQQPVVAAPADSAGTAAAAAAAVVVEDAKQLQQTVTEARTEGLAKIGEAVLEVQKAQSSGGVLKGLENLGKVGVNGKQVVDVKLSQGSVILKSKEAVISVKNIEPSTTPPTADSKVQVLPQVKP